VRIKKVYGLCIFLIITWNAYAWDGRTGGKIKSVSVTGGNNYGFRVSLEGSPTLCGNQNTWAYINESDSNYQAYVTVLMSAYLASKYITIFTNIETNSGQGYCHIGYISVE